MHHTVKTIYTALKHTRPAGSEVPLPKYLEDTVLDYTEYLPTVDNDASELDFTKALLEGIIERYQG